MNHSSGKWIGLSLSQCVGAIARGRMPQGAVKEIITGTRWTSDEEFDRMIVRYRRDHWQDCAPLAERIARELRIERKLVQPRVEHQPVPRVMNGKIWVDSREDITWIAIPKKLKGH
jgi:hypothetical protein